MYKLVLIYIYILFGISVTSSLMAQETEFGVSLGGSLYSGDLDLPSVFETVQSNTGFAFGGFFRFYFNDRLSLRTNLLIGKLKADDSNSTIQWQIERNLSFQSRIYEIANLLEYDILNISSNGSWRWTPYISSGLAFLSYNPKANYNETLTELQPLGTEGQGLEGYEAKYSLNVFTIPLGGGFKFHVSDRLSIQFEILGRFTFRDYLDDVSTTYVNPDEFRALGRNIAADLSYRGDEINSNLPLPATGTKRGQPDINDYYGTTMISFYFNLEGLGKGRGSGRGRGKIECPTFD